MAVVVDHLRATSIELYQDLSQALAKPLMQGWLCHYHYSPLCHQQAAEDRHYLGTHPQSLGEASTVHNEHLCYSTGIRGKRAQSEL